MYISHKATTVNSKEETCIKINITTNNRLKHRSRWCKQRHFIHLSY